MPLPTSLEALSWPLPRLAEALELLAHRAHLQPHLQRVKFPPPTALADPTALDRWFHAAATHLRLEAEPVTATFADALAFVQGVAPAIIRCPTPPPTPTTETRSAAPHFIVILTGGPQLTLLNPAGQAQRWAAADLAAALSQTVLGSWTQATDSLLRSAGIPAERRARASTLLLQEQFAAQEIAHGWMLRLAPGAGLLAHLRHQGLWQPLLGLLGAQAVQQILLVGAWWMIGQGALTGAFEWVRLYAWALLLFSALPFQWAVSWAASRFSLQVGALFKQRLIYGALRLQPDEIRHQGLGQFLGRVMESEAVELLALSGGWGALIALSQLITASVTLTLGINGWWAVAGLWGLVVGLALLGWFSWWRSRAWVHNYRHLTNDLVERMVGHRTRLAQEDPRTWHQPEDELLEPYLLLSAQMDQANLWLSALDAIWLVVGLTSVMWAFVNNTINLASFAISLGGVVLAYQALNAITQNLHNVIQLGLAWEQVGPLFQAAARPPSEQHMALPATTNAESNKAILLAKDIGFRYRERGRWVLQECSLKVAAGERWLLEGPSGGGKTTLAAVLAGLRTPETGTLLLHGYDRHSLGEEVWRQHIVTAPQFHENHVFTETFGFNLLMGRRWPPTPADLQEAEALCAELGLQELLSKMPSGLQQMVGESGWQLSHGERSRLYIARALLQKAEVVIMDESFGALDPENLERALRCVLQHAPTLIVIAHP